MNIRNEIETLKEYTSDEEKHEDVSIYKSIQHEFLEGYIGVILNEIDKFQSFEVYAYLKDKDIIASPLLFKKFEDLNLAISYYEEIVSLIENNKPEDIINRFKIRD